MCNPLDQLPIPLLAWYEQNARRLPWREDPTPYHVWLSEIMLQQTRVAAVLGYYDHFLAALPTVQALADCPEEKLLKLWQGLGYYARARNLQRAAQRVVQDYGGVFPASYAALLALPGIGDYTAGAISSIAFGLPVPAVDGNVLRVVARLTGDEGDITLPATRRRITDALARVIPLRSPGAFNQAMMELGATVCLPNGAPLCGRCPARHLCVAHAEGRTDRLPVKRAKKPRKVQELAVYFLFSQGAVALRRRPGRGLLAGLWEPPHVPLAEAPPPWAGQPRFCGTAKHIFTHIEWHMTGYTAQPAGPLPQGWVWADRAALQTQYAVPSAFQGFWDVIEKGLT